MSIVKHWKDWAIMPTAIVLVAGAIVGSFSSASAQSTGQTASGNWLTKDAAGFFTFLLVIVGSFQVGLFVWQLKLIRESLDDAKVAADAAQNAATAAQQSANIARDTLITTERAFVFLEDFDVDPVYAPRGQGVEIVSFVIRPAWRNNGTTPTRNMKIIVNWTPWAGDLPDGFGYAYGESVAPTSMFLGPRAREWSDPIKIPGNEATLALKGVQNIYVWGRVEYNDIFDKTRLHFTKWCYRLVFTRPSPTPQTQFVAFGPYNGSDEDTELQSASADSG